MATITKTATFTFDQAAVEARAAASRAMAPQERAAAMEARYAKASSKDFIMGRVF